MVLCKRHFTRQQSGEFLTLVVAQDLRAQVKPTMASSHIHAFLCCVRLLPQCKADRVVSQKSEGPQNYNIDYLPCDRKSLPTSDMEAWGWGHIWVELVEILNVLIYAK